MTCARFRCNGKQCRPWSDCSCKSSPIWVYTVWSSPVWVYSVYPDLSVWKLRIITVIGVFMDLNCNWFHKLPHDKANKMTVCPGKTQISLGNCQVWSESSLCAQWVTKEPSFRHADSEDSDQTGRMPRLIWVFLGRTCHFVCFDMRQLMIVVILVLLCNSQLKSSSELKVIHSYSIFDSTANLNLVTSFLSYGAFFVHFKFHHN